MREQLSFIFERKLQHLLSPDEIFKNANQDLLVQLKEDRRIERKTAKTHAKQLGEYFCMWANTTPDGGLLVLGMEANGSISGCSLLSNGELNDREKASYIYCSESRTDSRRIPVRNIAGNEDFVVLFRTYYAESKLIEDSSKNSYVRVGDEKHRLTDEEKYEYRINKGQIDLEQELTPVKFPEDFKIDQMNTFTDGVHRIRALSQHHSLEEIMIQRRLGKMDGNLFIPNKACVLLFAKDPEFLFPGCKIRFLRYEGEREETGERYNVIKDIWVEGCVPELIFNASRVLESQLRAFSRLGEDGKFYTAPEYPRDAWYEAIVNACVHRSYGLKNMNIFIKMFDDRLVIESPGAFPPFVTPENIYNTHSPRNPTLMNAMFYLEYVKCHNEGTRRMRDTMERMKLPSPQFEQREISIGNMIVRVTLRNNRKQRKVWIDNDAMKFLPEEIAKTLNEDEIRLVNFVGEHKRINVSECQRLLPHIKTWHTAKKLLLRLTEKGIFYHIHSKNIDRDSDAHFRLRPNIKPN
jgi:ATP-dependent DNA helicase RecG